MNVLETAGASVEDITFAVGYRDTATFRRLFQIHIGITPTAYRKRFTSSAGGCVQPS
jgi:transcriptional regulator GlxA family with amidase domain